jgi:hypothetical protein
LLYREKKIAVFSEIHAKHINALWAEHTISESYSWWYMTQVSGFKRSKSSRDLRPAGVRLITRRLTDMGQPLRQSHCSLPEFTTAFRGKKKKKSNFKLAA